MPVSDEQMSGSRDCGLEGALKAAELLEEAYGTSSPGQVCDGWGVMGCTVWVC